MNKNLTLLIAATAVMTLSAITANAQNVGIGTASPSAKLDVSGAIASREGTAFSNTQLIPSGGPFNDVVLPSSNGFFRIPSGVSNITGAFTLNGFAGGQDGLEVVIVNLSGYTMTISNESVSNGNSKDQILTGNGLSTLTVPNGSDVTLKYSVNAANTSSLGAWIVTAVQIPTTSGTVTSVTASSPLASSGGAIPNISLTGIVPVVNGGTGVNTFGGTSTVLFTTATNTLSAITTANNGVLVTSATGVPSIGTTLPSAVQNNITSVGTITSGTWNGTTIAAANGGTGVTAFGGTNTILYTTTTSNLSSIATAANGVLVTSAAGVPSIGTTLPSAVQGNITSVGTITSGTWNGTTIAVAHGGTGLTSAGANGTVLTVVGGVPAWTTATYPTTTTINELLYSSAANTVAGLAVGTTGQVLTTNSSGVPTWSTISASTVSGWALTGNSGTTPGTDFVGTTDANDLVFKTDGFEGMRVSNAGSSAPGNVVIGSGDNSISLIGGTLRAPSYGSALIGNATGVNLTIEAGAPTGKGGSGNIIFQALAANVGSPGNTPELSIMAEVMRITNTGALSFGSTGTATGTADNVLVSGGSGTNPSWGQLNLADATNAVTGTLAATNGGTGQSAYTIGDILYASTTSALSKLSDVATGKVLISGGAGTAPTWGQVSLTTAITGILPIANGGTNSGTALSGSGIMISNGTQIVQGALGTATTVLHGNASGAPTYSAVNLATDVTGTLPVANGGTGLTSYTTGSLLDASGTTTIGQINDVAVGDVLISGGTGVVPSYGKVALATAVSGTLPVANGGTGLTSVGANGTILTVISGAPAWTTATFPATTTSQQLLYSSAANTVSGLAVGTSGQVLSTNSSGNLAWITPVSGTVTSIATGTGLTGGPITSTGTISIATTAVTAGSYGSSTTVPTFTVNAEGQLTAASNTTITAAGVGGWSLTGNGSTTPGTDFVGTTDANDLVFKVDGTEEMRIDETTGNVVVGAGDATATTAGNTLRGPAGTGTNKAGVNLPIQAGNGTGTGGSGYLSFQTAPVAASSATANTMTEAMRIANTGNVIIGSGEATATVVGNLLRGPNGVGTNISGPDFTIAGGNGTGTGGGGDVVFQTAPVGTTGTTANTLTERVRINYAGNVIIGSGEASATVVGNLLRGPNGVGTNISGPDFTIAGGNGTGTGGGGDVVFQTAPVGTTGTTANTLTERVRINYAGNVIVGSGEATATVAGNTLRAPNVVGTNLAGTNLTITSGDGTGTGGSGSVIFQTAAIGTTGSTANTMTERYRITPTGALAIGGAANYGTSGNVLVSAGNAAPAWGAITLSNSASVTGTLPIANGGTGIATAPTSGQVLIGNSSGGYTPATLTAGTGVTITSSSGSITINSSGGSSTSWDEDVITGASGSTYTLNPAGYSFVKLEATGSFTLTTISGGANGSILVIYNSTNNMAVGGAGNIVGWDTFGTGGTVNAATFIYDANSSKWIMISAQ